MTIPPKFGRLTGVGAAAVIAALGLGTTILAPAPAKAAVFVGFGFGFPFGFPGYYYPPYRYYPPPSLLSDTTGLVSAVRRVSPFPRPRAIGIGGDAINHLYAAPRLDQCGRSILPGVQIEPGRWQSRDGEVRRRGRALGNRRKG